MCASITMSIGVNIISALQTPLDFKYYPYGRLIVVIITNLLPLLRMRRNIIHMLVVLPSFSIVMVGYHGWVVLTRPSLYITEAFMLGAHIFCNIAVSVNEWHFRKAFIAIKILERQQRWSEESKARGEMLLQNILPRSLAQRVKSIDTMSKFTVLSYPYSAVILTDIVGFTSWTSTQTSEQIISLLNLKFAMFDSICAEYGMEKIKTIGEYWLQ